jgi:protein-tyrosine phosphatase
MMRRDIVIAACALSLCMISQASSASILRDADGATVRGAERLIPLQGGSNFRDLGGYPAADGKHVRWGLLYRSAALPKLTDDDYRHLSTLHIRTVVELRSRDERQLSPTIWRAKPDPRIIAVDYSGALLFRRLRGYDGPAREFVTERLYWDIPFLLQQEYRDLFNAMLERRGALIFFDSIGVDRTGIAAGLILDALGVPREIIYQDYLLSTHDRQPRNEMADVDLQDYAATNAEARFLIEYRKYAEGERATQQIMQTQKPLMDARGRPLLQDAFEEIEADFGSVTNYLDQMLGVNAADIAKLRAKYLE